MASAEPRAALYRESGFALQPVSDVLGAFRSNGGSPSNLMPTIEVLRSNSRGFDEVHRHAPCLVALSGVFWSGRGIRMRVSESNFAAPRALNEHSLFVPDRRTVI